MKNGENRMMSVCCGCGALLPSVDGPTHRYMSSSPACWAAYGQVLAREYADRRLSPAHRLTVDSYACQHPGTPSAQSVQSIAVHLCRLFVILECGFPFERANDVMLEVKRFEHRFHWLTPPSTLGEITVLDALAVTGPTAHIEMVRRWADSVWSAWSVHHETIRNWVPASIHPKVT